MVHRRAREALPDTPSTPVPRDEQADDRPGRLVIGGSQDPGTKERRVARSRCHGAPADRPPAGIRKDTRDVATPDDAAERVYNFLHTLTIEAQMMARACGKTNIHSLEPEDLAALTMEASAIAGVPLAGTNYTVGVEDYHHL